MNELLSSIVESVDKWLMVVKNDSRDSKQIF